LCGITHTEYKGGNYFNDLQMPFSFLKFWSRKGMLLGALNGKGDLLQFKTTGELNLLFQTSLQQAIPLKCGLKILMYL